MKDYIYQLLNALACVHSLQIIHRDIKPSNFLYSRRLKLGKLIDFGLAQFIKSQNYVPPVKVQPTKSQAACSKKCTHNFRSVCTDCITKPDKRVPRAGTPGYRAPEVLLGYYKQTGAIDMWSTGVILLSLVSKRYPFFRSKNDLLALTEIISLFGTHKCVKAANDIGISLHVSENCSGISLKNICKESRLNELTSETQFSEFSEIMELMESLLVINPLHRISSTKALTLDVFKHD